MHAPKMRLSWLHRAVHVRWLALVIVLLSLGATLRAENYALLVGINTYPNVRQLKGAVADIVSVREIVRNDLKFPEANITVLLNEEATKANILRALDDLSRQTRAGDTIIWYYSGHGWVQNDVDGDEALMDPDDKLDEVLVPYDAVPFPRDRALEPNSTMVIDDEIGVRLSRLAGRRLVIVFDSCHSGTATRALPGENETRALYENYPLPPTPKTKSLRTNRETLDVAGEAVFIAAASPVQAASDMGEFEGKRHGAFTAGLLRTIRQAGPDWPQNLTLEQLFKSAREDMVNRGFATQTPSISARDGLGRVQVAQLLKPPAASELAQVQPGGAFAVQLAANKYQFEEGELLQLMVESDRDGYLYLFDINSAQTVTQLLPNRFSRDNRIRASEPREIPAAADKYQLRAGPPFGRGRVVAIVTAAPWTQADRLELPLGFEPVSDAQKNGLRDSLRGLQDSVSRSAGGASSGQPAWSSQKILVELYPKGSLDADGAPPGIARPPAATALTSPATPVAAAPSVAKTEAGSIVAPTSAAAAATAAAVTAAPPSGQAVIAASAAAPAALLAAAKKNEVANAALPGASRAIDDANLTREQQANLPQTRPEVFARLQQLAERFSPNFWQDVSGEFDSNFKPWRDFFVRYDFDQTGQGPNWPAPPRFQDETKRARNGSLTALLAPDPKRQIEEVRETPGVFRIADKDSGETYQLDMRPVVYWAVITSPTHYFFHYVCFHAEDWKPMFGHTGDLEGTTIVVDRQTEKMVAAFTLAHDDVGVTRGLDDEPEGNIGVLVNPNAESRGLFDGDDGRPVDGSLGMEATRDGEPAPKEHQDIYVQSRGHGQYGPHKIIKSRYVLYGSFFDESTWRPASFDPKNYPLADRFADITAKHKYKLVYIGAGAGADGTRAATEKTLWGEYRQLTRFAGGVNPPWDWRDNVFFKTGWWKDPRMIKKIGADGYRINPYLAEKR